MLQFRLVFFSTVDFATGGLLTFPFTLTTLVFSRRDVNSFRIMDSADLATADLDPSGIGSEAVRKAWATGFVPRANV